MLVEVKRINKVEATVVSSLDVAETFEKNHRDVMESIRNIESNISTAEFFRAILFGFLQSIKWKIKPNVPYDKRWFYSFGNGIYRRKSNAV